MITETFTPTELEQLQILKLRIAAGVVSDLTLEAKRLQFCRYLYETGKLGEW